MEQIEIGGAREEDDTTEDLSLQDFWLVIVRI